jgi:6-pyruvoyltetrahydropterin/6-carboxytetrahydropterin synthase
MYSLGVKQDFIAQHFLIGGDWGTENQRHSHHYRVEVQMEGDALDEHGYLVDIAKVKDNLDRLTSYFKDKTLNDLPEFKGTNPSIEHLARICHQILSNNIGGSNIPITTVKIWEDGQAWTAYSDSKQ